MILGTEWVIDAVGCDPAALADLPRLRSLFDRAIRDLDLHVLGEIAWHQFPSPGGVSGLALLSESHLACHTYPEFGAVTFKSLLLSQPYRLALGTNAYGDARGDECECSCVRTADS